MFTNINPQKYIPLPFFKNKLLRYMVYYFPDFYKQKKSSSAAVVFEMVEGSDKKNNKSTAKTREYKGSSFRMNLSQTEIAGLIGRIEYLNNHLDYLFDEKNYAKLKICTNTVLEHYIDNTEENKKMKTIFAFKLIERDIILAKYKESELGWYDVPLATISMGKKGVSMSINLTRDELLRMKTDLNFLYLLLFDLSTQYKNYNINNAPDAFINNTSNNTTENTSEKNIDFDLDSFEN